MKNILWLFLFFPLALTAQLDRINTGMNVAEFQKAVPEAIRDYEAESYWIELADTLHGIPGHSRWRVFTDTITEYQFVSEKVNGPTERLPHTDSGAVHALKVVAEIFRQNLELPFGAPTEFSNTPLHRVGAQTARNGYAAWWRFGLNDYVRIAVNAQIVTLNQYNAMNHSSITRSEPYELRIEVTHRSAFTQANYETGLSASAFFQRFPSLDAQKRQNQEITFSLEDQIGEGGHWKFVFTNDSLNSMRYNVYAGTAYRSSSDSAAYVGLKKKTEQLIREANHSFGTADTLSNRISSNYIPRERHVAYSVMHVYAGWLTERGPVIIQFLEIGGGKNPGTVFRLSVWFGEEY